MTRKIEITKDELQVVELIANGLTDQAIARRLGVSVVTVRRRAASFRVKVGARTRPEAVAIAAAQGWIKHLRVERPASAAGRPKDEVQDRSSSSPGTTRG